MSISLIQGLTAVLFGIVGYGFGWLSRGIAMDELKRVHKVGYDRRRRRPWWLVGASILLLLAIVGLLTLVSIVVQQRQVTQCFERETQSSRAAGIKLADSTLTMLDGLFSPEGTVDSRRSAIERWRDAYREHLEQLQQANAQHCVNE
jgi:Family of unknown function (DUF4006)